MLDLGASEILGWDDPGISTADRTELLAKISRNARELDRLGLVGHVR